MDTINKFLHAIVNLILVWQSSSIISQTICSARLNVAISQVCKLILNKFLIKEKNVSFSARILPQIKNRVGDVFKSAGTKLIGEIRSDYNGFEWLGFDFMLDDDLKLSLIEVNTNPCLETQSCILLQRLIPQMIDQSLKIAVDPFFGASENQYHTN